MAAGKEPARRVRRAEHQEREDAMTRFTDRQLKRCTREQLLIVAVLGNARMRRRVDDELDRRATTLNFTEVLQRTQATRRPAA